MTLLNILALFLLYAISAMSLGLGIGKWLARRNRPPEPTPRRKGPKPDKWSQFSDEQLAAIVGRRWGWRHPGGREALIRALERVRERQP